MRECADFRFDFVGEVGQIIDVAEKDFVGNTADFYGSFKSVLEGFRPLVEFFEVAEAGHEEALRRLQIPLPHFDIGHIVFRRACVHHQYEVWHGDFLVCVRHSEVVIGRVFVHADEVSTAPVVKVGDVPLIDRLIALRLADDSVFPRHDFGEQRAEGILRLVRSA